MKIKVLFAKLMELGNLSQTELSNRTGIPKSSINDYLHGTMNPNLKTFCKIVDACGYRVTIRKKKEVKDESK